jgi:hypothetical protein
MTLPTQIESMKIPKYLMEESRSRVQLLIVSEILWVSIFLCRGWNITYLDFSTLRDSLLAHSQV